MRRYSVFAVLPHSIRKVEIMAYLAIWDLDGTLVDSSLDLCASGNHVRQTMGLQPLSVPTVKAMIGDGLTALLQRMLPDGTDIDWAKSIFAEHYDQQCTKNTPLYQGVDVVLAALHQRGWKSALVSNKPGRWCGPILEANGILRYFSAIRGGDGVRKPAPIRCLRSVLNAGSIFHRRL